MLNDVNWLVDETELLDDLILNVKIRSTQKEVPAKIYKIDNGRIFVKLINYERAVTPGQACVIYKDDQLLGGGWIARNDANNIYNIA